MDFRFKQFGIRQDRTAMKVGTDGVLLGAWAEGGERILDIGTGTGLVALMMAQRFPHARITAIEIDPDAAQQAQGNVSDSPFAQRIEVIQADARVISNNSSLLTPHSSLKDYDSIVCNPPYYEHTLPSRSAERDTARSTQTLTFAQLMQTASRLLTPTGTLSIVAPAQAQQRLEAEAALCALYIKERVRVRTVERKPPKRLLLQFSPTRPATLTDRTVCLQAPDGQRSLWYAALTQAFYL